MRREFSDWCASRDAFSAEKPEAKRTKPGARQAKASHPRVPLDGELRGLRRGEAAGPPARPMRMFHVVAAAMAPRMAHSRTSVVMSLTVVTPAPRNALSIAPA